MFIVSFFFTTFVNKFRGYPGNNSIENAQYYNIGQCLKI